MMAARPQHSHVAVEQQRQITEVGNSLAADFTPLYRTIVHSCSLLSVVKKYSENILKDNLVRQN